MKFADNKNLYIRRALFVLLIVITAVLQHTVGDAFSIFGARAFLLIPLTVTIAINEKSMGYWSKMVSDIKHMAIKWRSKDKERQN